MKNEKKKTNLSLRIDSEFDSFFVDSKNIHFVTHFTNTILCVSVNAITRQ